MKTPRNNCEEYYEIHGKAKDLVRICSTPTDGTKKCKAGSRITAMFQGLERRMYEGVAGNKLLRNTPEGFRTVSGDGPGQMEVMRAGWSWGGQYGDLDNDGYLDLYVSNGLYTPPPGAATEVDL